MGQEEIRQPKNAEKAVEHRFSVAADSVPSEENTRENEDAVLAVGNNFLGVFDGMGGYSQGDVAAQTARDYLRGFYDYAFHDVASLEQAEFYVRNALIFANNAVYEKSQTEDPEMGTTASIVYVWEGPKGERKAIVGNVGDSRVYLFQNGILRQITLDDNDIRFGRSEEQARELQQKMSNVVNLAQDLLPEEQILFKERNVITQSLGQEYVDPRIHTIDFPPGARLLLCTDGISDNLTFNEIEKILASNPSNIQAVAELIEAAQQTSRDERHPRRKPDDMTVIMAGEYIPKPPQNDQVTPVGQAAEIMSQKRLSVGSKVRVRTDHGTIEEGWIITAIDVEGVATVKKALPSSEKSKKIPLAELESLNNRIHALYDYLLSIDDTHTRNKLIQQVMAVLEGRATLASIASAGDLWKIVASILLEYEV